MYAIPADMFMIPPRAIRITVLHPELLLKIFPKIGSVLSAAPEKMNFQKNKRKKMTEAFSSVISD